MAFGEVRSHASGSDSGGLGRDRQAQAQLYAGWSEGRCISNNPVSAEAFLQALAQTPALTASDRSQLDADVARFRQRSALGLKYLLLTPGDSDRDLPEGHVIAEADIWARRPGSGEISVQHFDRLVGARLTRAVRRNQQLLWSDIDGVTAQANS